MAAAAAKLSDDELSPVLGVGDPEAAAEILLGYTNTLHEGILVVLGSPILPIL